MQAGFIGLGTMGGSMALNARAGGFSLMVHDIRREVAAPHLEAGCTWAASVEEIARACDVVLTSLPGPREVEAVGESLIKGMRPGSAWFDLSTNSPTVVRRLHERFAKNGIAVLDSPVSGGPAGAKSRKLALWVGGEREVFDHHRKLLDAIGDQVRYIGTIGAGSIAKLVHNGAGYAMQLALVELFTMGVKAGVEPLALWSAIRQGALGRKRTFDRIADQFLQGKFEPPAFALELAHKDMTLATELGREIGVPMRMAGIAHAEMTEARNRGWDKRDSRSYLLIQQERAGLDIKVPLEDIQRVLERDG